MGINSLFSNKCVWENPESQISSEKIFEQCSGPSNYNIDIDWTNDQSFDIDFSHRKIRKILLKINSNKASGPDEIHGKVLKNCAVSLAYPLSLLFKISYNMGSLPHDWKLANVIPVHKKR